MKLKEESTEQGILEILLKIIEIIYYKTIPPKLFVKAFSSKKSFKGIGYSDSLGDGVHIEPR